MENAVVVLHFSDQRSVNKGVLINVNIALRVHTKDFGSKQSGNALRVVGPDH